MISNDLRMINGQFNSIDVKKWKKQRVTTFLFTIVVQIVVISFKPIQLSYGTKQQPNID